MKAVTAYTAPGDLAWQRQRLLHFRPRPVECRVEARHLGRRVRLLGDAPDWREIVRLVQRRKRDQSRQVIGDVGVDALRHLEARTAVHDPMSDADQSAVGNLGAQPVHEKLGCQFVIRLDAVHPRLLAERVAIGIARRKMSGDADAFDLPFQSKAQIFRRVIERELDARRARVQNKDQVGHGNRKG